MNHGDDGVRLDKWLFYARIFKSRSVAAERIQKGGIRVNGQSCQKPGRVVRAGDLIVLSAYGRLRSLEVVSVGHRRGPAPEAQQLYHEPCSGLIDPVEETR